MGIEEEIVTVFLKKLKEGGRIPDSIIAELKSLWESGEDVSREKILDVIRKGCEGNGGD